MPLVLSQEAALTMPVGTANRSRKYALQHRSTIVDHYVLCRLCILCHIEPPWENTTAVLKISKSSEAVPKLTTAKTLKF